MPQLFGSPISFFVNKVRYVLNALELSYEFKQLNMMAGEHKQEDHLRRHPAGKVPAIQDGDFTLFESNAIIRYYADTNGSKFYPKDPKARALVDEWMDFTSIHIGNGITRVVFNTVFAPIVPGATVDQESLKCGHEFLDKYLPVVDTQLGETKYIAGEELTLADFTLLATLDPAEAGKIDLAKYPNISKWRAELMKQDWYTACHANFSDALQQMLGALK